MTDHQFAHFPTAGFTGTIQHSPKICETGNGNLRAISEEVGVDRLAKVDFLPAFLSFRCANDAPISHEFSIPDRFDD